MSSGHLDFASASEIELERTAPAYTRAVMLLDTNVLIYASDTRSPHCSWARKMISDAVAGEGAAINAVSLAEICVGDAEPSTVADRIRGWRVEALDVPVAAAEISARAYLN